MKKITAVVIVLLLGGCAWHEKPSFVQSTSTVTKTDKTNKTDKIVKHPAPCPCSPTANQVVQKRWFGGWKFFH